MAKEVLTYTAHFIPEEEGGYSVVVPALPGCNTQGDTLKEAEENAREAIQCYLESLIADGEPIPKEAKAVSKKLKISVNVSKL